MAWAAENRVFYLDIQTDVAPNALESFDAARCNAIRDACETAGINLGLHTLSGVNVAELSPFCRDAVDEYLRAYVDLSARIGARWRSSTRPRRTSSFSRTASGETPSPPRSRGIRRRARSS